MTIWWCPVHERNGDNDENCVSMYLGDGGPNRPCRMAEMELHPAGSRVVTAEALVIEKVDGEWPEWAIRAADRLDWVARITLDDLAEGQDALAQSKEGAE